MRTLGTKGFKMHRLNRKPRQLKRRLMWSPRGMERGRGREALVSRRGERGRGRGRIQSFGCASPTSSFVGVYMPVDRPRTPASRSTDLQAHGWRLHTARCVVATRAQWHRVVNLIFGLAFVFVRRGSENVQIKKKIRRAEVKSVRAISCSGGVSHCLPRV